MACWTTLRRKSPVALQARACPGRARRGWRGPGARDSGPRARRSTAARSLPNYVFSIFVCAEVALCLSARSDAGVDGEDPGLATSLSGGAWGIRFKRKDPRTRSGAQQQHFATPWPPGLWIPTPTQPINCAVHAPQHNADSWEHGPAAHGTACDVGAEERTQGWPLFVWWRLGHRIPTRTEILNFVVFSLQRRQFETQGSRLQAQHAMQERRRGPRAGHFSCGGACGIASHR